MRRAQGSLKVSIAFYRNLRFFTAANTSRAESTGVTDDMFAPFAGETDFAMASWLLQSQCTKGDINRFLKDTRLEGMHGQLSYKNATELFGLLHKLRHGIRNPTWNESTIVLQPDMHPEGRREYSVQYQDIVSAIRFLIGHRPFRDNLAYAPVRQFTDEGKTCRAYNEMHTGDWWWRIQSQLPDNATVVPLILSTDKTVLTQHHGDAAVWPVYFTIGNLDRATRRKQTRPAMALLGFIPVAKELGDGCRVTKMQIYHEAMRVMLARE